MKSKATTYVLGILVAAVWGIIIYRIIEAVRNDDTPSALPVVSSVPKELLNDFALVPDTTDLKLNYRDPFRSAQNADRDTAQIPIQKLIRLAVHPAALIKPMTPLKAAINWNAIRYAGYIRNPHTKKLIAMMNVNGKSIMLSEGETAGDVRLLKNLKDSVRVAYQGKTHYITIHNDVP